MGSGVHDLDTGTSEPAWAEHARPRDDGLKPCDDGRAFNLTQNPGERKRHFQPFATIRI